MSAEGYFYEYRAVSAEAGSGTLGELTTSEPATRHSLSLEVACYFLRGNS